MDTDQPQTVIAIYRVQPEREQDFMAVLRQHHPTLKKVGLVTDDPPVIYRGEEEGRPILFEIFRWKNAQAPATAHELPEIMAIWEPMGAMAEERGGRPKFEFPHVERLELKYDA